LKCDKNIIWRGGLDEDIVKHQQMGGISSSAIK
jgi:hypothetical protein